MADKTKFLDHAGLVQYDTKVKEYIAAEDAKILDAAEKYADGLADNYDPAGTAETKTGELEGRVNTKLGDFGEKTVKAYIDDEIDAEADRAAEAELALGERIDELVTAGGEPNKLEKVKVNGEELDIDDGKAVDILVVPGGNGAINVNGKDVAVTGLKALAFKDKVAEADLETALATKINGKAEQEDFAELEGKVNVLIGSDTNKSVRAIAALEVARIIEENATNEDLDTLEEIAAWLSGHPEDVGEINLAISKLQAIVDGIGDDGEKATVKAYVDDAIAALNIGDYAKVEDLLGTNGAITLLGGRVGALEGKVDVEKVSEAITAAKGEAIAEATRLNGAMDTRMVAVEGKLDGVTKVTTSIETAKGEAAADATSKANAAQAAAIAAAATDAQTKANAAKDAAIAAAATDAQNKANAAQQAAIAKATELDQAMDARVDLLEGKVGEGFVAITTAEINGLFA